MRKRILAFLRRVGFDYSCFRIYSITLSRTADGSGGGLPAGYRIAEVTAGDLEASPYPEIRACQGYLGAGARLFGVFRGDGVLACAQCIWFGERFSRVGFWPLSAADAASMHLICIESERGKRLATCLKKATAERMRVMGFQRMYSRIWWSNTASRRVSERAGWTRVGTVLEIKVPGRRQRFRFVKRQADSRALPHAEASMPRSQTLR